MVLVKLSQHHSEIVRFSPELMHLTSNKETTVLFDNQDVHWHSDILFLSTSYQYNFNAKTFVLGANQCFEKTSPYQKSIGCC